MILLNFSHPLIPDHLRQVEAIAGQKVKRVIEVPSQIDIQQPLPPQVSLLADQTELSQAEWQTLLLLINPPALNFITVTLLAELHGRCGYFPAYLRLRPVKGCSPTQYEVAEILNLQAIRDQARTKRC